MAIKIGKREIGPGQPAYVIAEMSANHGQQFETAAAMVEAAKKAGADAVKLQTYTPDTITLDVHNPYFTIKGTHWEGRNLYDLYREAYMPWEWQPRLKQLADELKIDLFSSPFDLTAVDFLEKMGVPAYKIASFEIVDMPLLQCVARTGKPIIISTGMARLAEIEEAIECVRAADNPQVALLKCNSAYPSPMDEMNLRTIPHLTKAFQLPVGLSDHTLGIEAAVAAVALGACIIEKHFTLSRQLGGPDAAFSIEPDELARMIAAIRNAELALGKVCYAPSTRECESRAYRRSLFAASNIRRGEVFNPQNVRSVRPADGLHPRYFHDIMGRRAACDIDKGTPMAWHMIDEVKQPKG